MRKPRVNRFISAFLALSLGAGCLFGCLHDLQFHSPDLLKNSALQTSPLSEVIENSSGLVKHDHNGDLNLTRHNNLCQNVHVSQVLIISEAAQRSPLLLTSLGLSSNSSSFDGASLITYSSRAPPRA